MICIKNSTRALIERREKQGKTWRRENGEDRREKKEKKQRREEGEGKKRERKKGVKEEEERRKEKGKTGVASIFV